MPAQPLRRCTRLILGAAAALLTGCTARYGTLALGQYELFSPFADLTRGRREVELGRPGFVAVLDVVPADPAFRQRPDYVTFRPIYPLSVHDSTFFATGTHRLRYAVTNEPMVTLCREIDIPSIDGCREARAGSFRQISGPVPSASHYLVIVAEEYVDPFTLAYYLNEAVRMSDTLPTALHRRNPQDAAEALSLAIADMPGLSAWSGYYVVRLN
jgi:hypothetical protein